MKPVVSIIMPSYNAEKYIEIALQSIKSQTFSLNDLEVILIDDQSTDKTLEKIDIFKKENPRFPIIIEKNPKHKDVAATRNSAMRIAEGDIFLYMDADDIIPENCVYRFVRAFDKNPEVGFVYSDHAQIRANTKGNILNEDIIKVRNNKPDFEIGTFLMGDYNYIGHMKSIRSEVKIPFDEKLSYSEDSDWIINLGFNEIKFFHLQEILYFWRRGIDSISTRKSEEERGYYHNLVFQRGLNKLKL